MTTKIVTDSTCDLPAELVNEHGISVIPMYINFGEQGYQDGIEISRQEFYQRQRKNPHSRQVCRLSVLQHIR